MAKPQLEIYVHDQCFGCEEARSLGAQVRDRFPGIAVAVKDLSHEDGWPEFVAAVPTYVLQGKVLVLGNPEPSWLFAKMEEALGVSP